MADKRMFSKSIIDSDAFLEMPQSTQNLYFHLSMRADDDGFINNPKSIMRIVGCKDDDIKILLLKKFLITFESGVVVIKHWKIHNYIAKDRYKETNYKEEKSLLTLDENKAYTLSENTDCIQVVDTLSTQIRLGKNRLDKDNKESKPMRHKYGEYNHVLLTGEQRTKLINDFGIDKTNKYIKKVDEYCQEHGKTYNDYNLTIRKWLKKDNPQGNSKRNYEITLDENGHPF